MVICGSFDWECINDQPGRDQIHVNKVKTFAQEHPELWKTWEKRNAPEIEFYEFAKGLVKAKLELVNHQRTVNLLRDAVPRVRTKPMALSYVKEQSSWGCPRPPLPPPLQQAFAVADSINSKFKQQHDQHGYDRAWAGSFGHLKLLLVIGDSVDRYMIDDWCDSQRSNNISVSHEVFGQEPDGNFGRWSQNGRISEDFQNLLESSGVAGWKAWQSRICIVPELGVATAFVHNFKGVDTQGPWWHERKYKELYNMSCTETLIPAECHNMQRFLGLATGAITEYLQVKPEVTMINSNRWDVARMNEIQHVPKESFTNGEAQAEWKHNATKFIQTIKEIVPGSQIIWHTTPARSEGGVASEDEGVRYLNEAARELCKKEGIPVQEMEVDSLNGIEMDFRDLRHPKPEFLSEFMQDLVKTHLGR